MYERIKTLSETSLYEIDESVNEHIAHGWELISTQIIKDYNKIGNLEFICFYVIGLPKQNK